MKMIARSEDRSPKEDNGVKPDSMKSPGHRICISLLTGGDDRPYVFGLVSELLAKDINIELIGSELLDFPEFRGKAGLKFLDLRGSFNPSASFASKITRVLKYYSRLITYAPTPKPRIFH